MKDREITEATLENFKENWDAKRILLYLVNFYVVDERGISLVPKIPTSPSNFKWQYRRLLSALKAYGIIEGRIDDFYNERIPISWLIQDVMAKEKIDKFLKLCNEYFENDRLVAYFKNHSILNSPYGAKDNFVELFKLLTHFEHIRRWNWRFIEAYGCGIALQVISNIYLKDISPIDEKIKEMMTYLMDEEFTKTFSERELILKYDYPTITDQELHEMSLYWD